MNMRIGPNPAFLRIGVILGVLFTAGCAEYGQQPPVSFGSVQIAEKSDHGATINRFSRIWMRVARQAIEDGHPDTAIRFAQKAIQAYPESDEPLRILALAYRQKSGTEVGCYLAGNAAAPGPVARIGGRTRGNLLSASGGGAPIATAYSISAPEQSRRPAVGAASARRASGAPELFRRKTAALRPVVPTSSRQGAYRVQLAAYADLDDAMRGKNLLTRRLPDDFPRLGVFVRHRPATSGERINYRLRSIDPTDRSQAAIYCKVAVSAGFSCLPIRQTGSPWQLVGAGTAPQVAQVAHPKAAVKRTDPIQTVGSRAADPARPLFKIQLAAYRNHARAVRGKRILSKSLPATFPPLELLKRNVYAEDSMRINYWVRSRDVWPRTRARALCDTARAAGHACLLIEPRSTIWPPIVAVR